MVLGNSWQPLDQGHQYLVSPSLPPAPPLLLIIDVALLKHIDPSPALQFRKEHIIERFECNFIWPR